MNGHVSRKFVINQIHTQIMHIAVRCKKKKTDSYILLLGENNASVSLKHDKKKSTCSERKPDSLGQATFFH